MIRLTPAATIATMVLADAADALIVIAADPTTVPVKVAKMMMGEAMEAIASAASEKISTVVARAVATAAATLVMTMGAATTAMAPATAKEVSAPS